MSAIRAERMTARIPGEMVMFLIGMRINRVWKIHKWLPVALAMPRMVQELHATRDCGFLGARQWFGNPTLMVQYWRSFADLERYARDRSAQHLPAWAAFNRAVASGGDVGIWHEAYQFRAGDYECIYNNMPLFGLAKATTAVPASGALDSAGGRLRGRATPR
jgi:hypothetical protein